MISKTHEIISHSLAETHDFGQALGSLAPARIILALIGDLGTGKTSLVQGIARGLDIPASYYITSPSYTLINEYPGRSTLFHVDLYRIENPEDLNEIGFFDILEENGVIAVEWADKLGEDTFSEYMSLNIEYLGNDSRKISLTAYGLEAANLLKKLEKI
jgi:tRNA threonylcarbamoyladenosine biosynthesis protein TsaE